MFAKKQNDKIDVYEHFITKRFVEEDGVKVSEMKAEKGVRHKITLRDDESIVFKKVKNPVEELFVFVLDDEKVKHLDRDVELTIDSRRIPEDVQVILRLFDNIKLN